MGKVIAAGAYAEGRRVATIDIADSKTWAAKRDHFVWVGFHEPDEAELRQLQDQFGLHELAIEDALSAHQRPKIEQYGETTFLVLRTAACVEGHIALGETYIFVGRGYVISVRRGSSASYAPVRQRVEAAPEQLAHGEDYVVYALVDFIVDNYQVAIERLAAEVESIEEHILDPPLAQAKVAQIYALRRELQRFRLVVAPTAEVCRRLETALLPGIDPAFRPYYRDIVDHVNRAIEQIDTLRETLSFAFEASLLFESSRQGEVGRRLAGWAAILAVPTAIAGIYGMNFEQMPELRWRFGYPAVLVVIVTVCVALYVRFRRAGWI